MAVVGCGNEYELQGQHRPDKPKDTADTAVEDTGEPVVPTCEDRVLPGYETSTDAECENEIQVGTFTPVVEWEKTAFSTFSSR